MRSINFQRHSCCSSMDSCSAVIVAFSGEIGFHSALNLQHRRFVRSHLQNRDEFFPQSPEFIRLPEIEMSIRELHLDRVIRGPKSEFSDDVLPAIFSRNA